MPDKVQVSGIDYSYEGTSVGLYITTLTAANFDAQITAAQSLQSAIQGVSLIDFDGLTVRHVDSETETDQPASVYAQREAKWLVRYNDPTANKIGSFEIGGADLTLLDSGGKKMDVSGGAGAALVAALEANALSPAGNAITVIEILHVGRNN